MSDKDKNWSKMCGDCFSGMREMMSGIMHGKGGPCCASAETEAGMMPKCCPVPNRKEGETEKPGQESPK